MYMDSDFWSYLAANLEIVSKKSANLEWKGVNNTSAVFYTYLGCLLQLDYYNNLE